MQEALGSILAPQIKTKMNREIKKQRAASPRNYFLMVGRIKYKSIT
jgi:hypothetical protein